MVYCNIVIWDPNIASRVRKNRNLQKHQKDKTGKVVFGRLAPVLHITNVNLNILPTYTRADTAQTEALITWTLGLAGHLLAYVVTAAPVLWAHPLRHVWNRTLRTREDTRTSRTHRASSATVPVTYGIVLQLKGEFKHHV